MDQPLHVIHEYLLSRPEDLHLEGRLAETLLTDIECAEKICREAGALALAEAYERAAEVVEGDSRERLRLLSEAVRLDQEFLLVHPESFFQTMWNRCWWYDHPEAAFHYVKPEEGWLEETPPWEKTPLLFSLLERWRIKKEQEAGFRWLRSLRPTVRHLAQRSGQVFTCEAAERKHEWRGGCGGGWRVRFSPDGRWLADDESGAYLWELKTGRPFPSRAEGWCSISSTAFTRDGIMAARHCEATIRIREIETRREQVLRGPEWKEVRKDGLPLYIEGEYFEPMVFSPDGTVLVCGSQDGIWTWKRASREWISDRRFGLPDSAVWSLDFSPDGRWLASGSEDGNVRLWAMTTSTGWLTRLFRAGNLEPEVLRGHQGSVRSVTFSPDGRWLASGGDDGTVRLWEVESRRQIQVFDGKSDEVGFSSNSLKLFAGDHETTTIWDLATGKRQQVSMSPNPALYSTETHPWLPLWREEGMIMWEWSSQREVARLPLSLRSPKTSPYDPRLVVGMYQDDLALYFLEVSPS